MQKMEIKKLEKVQQGRKTRRELSAVVQEMERVILDKPDQVRLSLTCLLARGHLLIEDLPGLGKTVLAGTISRVLDLDYKRIQFTSDLLPADIIGTSIYDRGSGSFRFTPGPVFTNVLLVDEVNRATPKTQSALLEAMEERQVSVEGSTRPLPEPFFVIATQNPLEQSGTFPLPESQLDRFLLRVEMGYPSREAEFELFNGEDRRSLLEKITPRLGADELLKLQKEVGDVHASSQVLDYLYRVLEFTRDTDKFQAGLSTRAALGLLHAAKAWAVLHGRNYLIPGDIQKVLPGVAGHRLVPLSGYMKPGEIGTLILESVPVEE